MLCASLCKKKHNARKAVWFTKATVHWSNFYIFVDSIGSQIILRMIRESKMSELQTVSLIFLKHDQGRMMIWCIVTELLHLKLPTKCWHKHFLSALLFNNSVRMYRIRILLQPFSISIQCTIGLCKLIFNWASSIFTLFEPHDYMPIMFWSLQTKLPIMW